MELTEQEQEALKQGNLLWSMVETKGYREVFRPYLEAKLRESFPDPSKFTREEEFIYAAKISSVFKKVISEILGWLDESVEDAKQLKRKEKGEIAVNPFDIGRDEE